VIRAFVALVDRFRKDERGAFGIIFAVMAIVLVAMSGATVDFTAVQQARTRAQIALDSAALALQPSIYITPLTAAQSTIQKQAQTLLLNRLQDASISPWIDCATPAKPGQCAHVQIPKIDLINGQLTLQATIQVPMVFVSLVGVTSMSPTVVSVSTRKKLNLEVAMVLDNSGSMANTMGYNYVVDQTSPTRMQTLKDSAKCAVNILYFGVSSCSTVPTGLSANPNVRMALIPFTAEVNVGAANASTGWIDRKGTGNPITLMHFDDNDRSTDTFAGPLDRISLFPNIMNGTSAQTWGGCVEARANDGTAKQYDTDDTPPDKTKPDTLFTPYIVPDEPGVASTKPGKSVSSNSQFFYESYLDDNPSKCDWKGSCSSTDTGTTTTTQTTTTRTDVATTTNDKSGKTTAGPTTTTTTTGPTTTTTTSTVNSSTFTSSNLGLSETGDGYCSCPTDSAQSTGQVSNAGPTTTDDSQPSQSVTKSGSGKNATTTPTNTTTQTHTEVSSSTKPVTTTCSGQTYTPRDLSNRVLQERMCKYVPGAAMGAAPRGGADYGPNGDCPAAPILPLSGLPTSVTSAIDAMVAQGATNVQEGAAWGLRVLSPTVPFTEGAVYGQTTSKVMIIMTDGENTMYPYTYDYNFNGAVFYSAYGYPIDNRLGTTSTDDTVLEAVMNTRLSTTCANAKALGITIYTIGVDVADTSNPTNNKSLLTKCASQTGFAYFPNTAADLQAAFV
jgi:Flp pilus assembly protein TadG